MDPICAVQECHGDAVVRGFCTDHASPSSAQPAPYRSGRQPIGARVLCGEGYVWVVGPDRRRIAEHRLVMEAYLGRPLAQGETVHHVNGDRLDNRLGNLQLWCSPPRFGQRASDLIAFVADNYRAEVQEYLASGQLPLLAFGDRTDPRAHVKVPAHPGPNRPSSSETRTTGLTIRTIEGRGGPTLSPERHAEQVQKIRDAIEGGRP